MGHPKRGRDLLLPLEIVNSLDLFQAEVLAINSLFFREVHLSEDLVALVGLQKTRSDGKAIQLLQKRVFLLKRFCLFFGDIRDAVRSS